MIDGLQKTEVQDLLAAELAASGHIWEQIWEPNSAKPPKISKTGYNHPNT